MILIFVEEHRPIELASVFQLSGETLTRQPAAYIPLRPVLPPTVIVPIANYTLLVFFLDVKILPNLSYIVHGPFKVGAHAHFGHNT